MAYPFSSDKPDKLCPKLVQAIGQMFVSVVKLTNHFCNLCSNAIVILEFCHHGGCFGNIVLGDVIHCLLFLQRFFELFELVSEFINLLHVVAMHNFTYGAVKLTGSGRKD